MSLPRETMMELMDGELDGEAKVRAESLASTNPEARRFVLSIEHNDVGAFLANDLEKRAEACGVDTIAEAVLARIRSADNRGAVLSVTQGLGGHPLGGPAIAISGRPLGEMGDRGGGDARTRWRTSALCGALALAAGLALYVGRRPHFDDGAPEATIKLAPPATSSKLALESPVEGVEVDEIDSPVHDISVFEITENAAPAAANPSRRSSVVIWVEDERGSK
jgi:hypothetical protein